MLANIYTISINKLMCLAWSKEEKTLLCLINNILDSLK